MFKLIRLRPWSRWNEISAQTKFEKSFKTENKIADKKQLYEWSHVNHRRISQGNKYRIEAVVFELLYVLNPTYYFHSNVQISTPFLGVSWRLWETGDERWARRLWVYFLYSLGTQCLFAKRRERRGGINGWRPSSFCLVLGRGTLLSKVPLHVCFWLAITWYLWFIREGLSRHLSSLLLGREKNFSGGWSIGREGRRWRDKKYTHIFPSDSLKFTVNQTWGNGERVEPKTPTRTPK